MESINLVAYLVVAAASLAVAYVIGRLRLPRWVYWTTAVACFAGSVGMSLAPQAWAGALSWSTAIRIGLAAVAGAAAGLGFHGGLGAHLRSNTSLERTREG